MSKIFDRTVEEVAMDFQEYYNVNISDLPPVEGEVVQPGMNWIWFEGYKDTHTAFLRWCELTAQNVPPEREAEVCRYFGIGTEFRLHR